MRFFSPNVLLPGIPRGGDGQGCMRADDNSVAASRSVTGTKETVV